MSRSGGKGAGSGSKHQGVQKRRAVPPGLLRDLLQARDEIRRVGLKEGHAVAPSAAGRSTGAAAGPAGPRSSSAAYVPPRTLPLLFAQRKHFLQQHKAKAQHADAFQRQPGEGLLALPEDVLLKIVCLLSHDELQPLFQVRKGPPWGETAGNNGWPRGL